MSGGGGSGFLGQALNKTAQAPAAQPGAGYTPAQTQPTYSPAFSSNQAVQFSPAVQQAAQQQMMYQQQQNPYFSQMRQGYSPQQQGLQQLLGSMMNRYQAPQGLPQQQMPMQQMPMQQMPMYQNPALRYQPNRAPAEQSLNRVAKSVVLQQKEAAEAEAARLKAELEAAQAAQSSQSDYGYYGGGG